MGHYKNKLFQRRKDAAGAAARREEHGGDKKKKKHISFDLARNKVSFVKPPPRVKNSEYWFTEVNRIEKKALTFDLEPNVTIEVTVDCRMQLLSLAQPNPSGKERAYVEVCQEAQLSMEDMSIIKGMDNSEASELLETLFSNKKEEWICIGSVGKQVQRLRVMLPPGMYKIRCVGNKNVRVFSQVWDIEQELV